MAKVVGYIIGGIFVIGMLLPIPLSLYFLFDRAYVLTTYDKKQATITRCYTVNARSTSTKRTYSFVAETPDGERVKGVMGWQKSSKCKAYIGDRVEVRINRDDPDNGRIVTFYQFWFLPLLFSVIAWVIYPIAYMAKKRKQRQHQ